MIHLSNVTDTPHLFGKHTDLFVDASLYLPEGCYALLSHRPELHRGVLDILGHLRSPRHGIVQHDMLISWPIGRMGFIRGKLTGLQIARFICEMYGIEAENCYNFLYGILTSPEYLEKEVAAWPNYMRQEYTFSIGLVPDFDAFIVDAAFPVPNSRFGRIWNALFNERLEGRSLILSGHNDRQIRNYCAKALVYDQGTLRVDDNLDSCLKHYPLKPFQTERLLAERERASAIDESFDEQTIFIA